MVAEQGKRPRSVSPPIARAYRRVASVPSSGAAMATAHELQQLAGMVTELQNRVRQVETQAGQDSMEFATYKTTAQAEGAAIKEGLKNVTNAIAEHNQVILKVSSKLDFVQQLDLRCKV